MILSDEELEQYAHSNAFQTGYRHGSYFANYQLMKNSARDKYSQPDYDIGFKYGTAKAKKAKLKSLICSGPRL